MPSPSTPSANRPRVFALARTACGPAVSVSRTCVALWALLLGSLSSYASLPVAHADQIAVMDESDTFRVRQALEGVHEVRILCTGCQAARARLTHFDEARFVHLASANGALFALYLDGVHVDFRDVYVVRRARWMSLSHLAYHMGGGRPQTLPARGFDDRGQPPAQLAPLPPVVHTLSRRCELLGSLPLLTDAIVRCGTPEGVAYEDVDCRVQESADFGGEPGPETLLVCDFANYDGAVMITDARSVRWLLEREAIVGIGVSVAEIVPNGDGVHELVVGYGTEDGSSDEILALFEDGWQPVFSLDTSSGMMDTGESASACIVGSSPAEGAHIVVRSQSRGSRVERVEHLIWRAAARHFVEATPAELGARAAPTGAPRCL